MMTSTPFRLLANPLAAALFFASCFSLSAQDTTRKEPVIYSFIVNRVPPNFPAPLLGFVNIASGNQKNAQIGFSNQNLLSLTGVQTGFVNTIGGRLNGTQIGFINVVKDSVKGVQTGFVNIAGRQVNGVQIGFVNTTKDSVTGLQTGFVNSTGSKLNGAQIGFVNTTKDTTKGAQVGFVNTADKKISGAQIGFVNLAAKGISGTQIGFVNVADSITEGAPIGFISIVRKGGYQAFEVSVSSLYPVNVAYKIGTERLYTSVLLSYNPDYSSQVAYGASLGSVFHLSRTFAFIPEAAIQSSIEKRQQMFVTLAPLFSIKMFSGVSMVFGPTTSWVHKGTQLSPELYEASPAFYNYNYDKRNGLSVGAQAGLRFTIKK